MEAILEFFKNFDFFKMVGVVTVILNALIGVCLLIPGDQPEKFLQQVVDFLKKFSR